MKRWTLGFQCEFASKDMYLHYIFHLVLRQSRHRKWTFSSNAKDSSILFQIHCMRVQLIFLSSSFSFFSCSFNLKVLKCLFLPILFLIFNPRSLRHPVQKKNLIFTSCCIRLSFSFSSKVHFVLNFLLVCFARIRSRFIFQLLK